MNAIKKRLQTLKIEKDLALDKADSCDQKAKEAQLREENLKDQVRELTKKLMQMENDLKLSRIHLDELNTDLQDKERIHLMTQSELAILNRRMREWMENLEKSEERRITAHLKLSQAMESAEEAKRICKVLENRSKLDKKRMDQLTSQLKEARLIAEDADTKSDEISKQLAFVEDELEGAEERVKTSEAKIVEREDELFVVGNILKSLEVSEVKANQRIEEFKLQVRELKSDLKRVEKRAIAAESFVKVFSKEMDAREDRLFKEKEKYKYICNDLDSTFAELTGF